MTMQIEEKRAQLISIIRERSYGTGVQITLASGRVSDFYFNLKPTMLHPQGARLIGDLIVDHLADRPIDYVGGLEMGAVPVATAVAAASAETKRPLPAFFIRKQAKDHGTQGLVEGLVKGTSVEGARVVVLEDVTTTGGSAMKAIAILKSEGAIVDCVVTIVDRQEGAAKAFADARIPFEPVLSRTDFL